MLDLVLKNKKMTIYQCAKLSGIPYTTLSEIVRGKTRIEKCSAETVYRLSKILNISMEDLLADSLETRSDFEIFKSNICHQVKDNGEIDFIIMVLQNDDIRRYWNKQWYIETFYLLAMVDYLSRINDIPLCTRYDDIRDHTLSEPVYPRDVRLASKLTNDSAILEACKLDAIPEFYQFNIMENEVRNVY